MLAKAKEEWDQEIVDKQSEKERYLAERVTPLHTSGLSLSQLQVFLRPERGASSSGAQGLAFTAPPLCSAPRTCAGSCTRRLRLWTRSGMTSKPSATTTPGRSAPWKWATGARTWRPCRGWRGGRRCSTPPSPPRGSERCARAEEGPQPRCLPPFPLLPLRTLCTLTLSSAPR
uniref:Troponin I1, slow skeletal type n=1 Tax=Cairina moschata TaxID=8855 RepID=A0A8C3BXJ6_CAIMO